MDWKINYDPKVEKDLRKLSVDIKTRIVKYINERIAFAPFDFGEALKGHLQGLYKYRVDNYRIICEIQENIVTVLVLSVGHRKDIYEKKING